jgi:hypothetical protein
VVLPDSYLNNNPAFQDLFLHDTHGIRSAFTSGRLVLALRDTTSGLSELNAEQGQRRAAPTMHERAMPFVAAFDRFHREHGLVALEWSLSPSATLFTGSVQRFIDDPSSPLMPAERESLADAVAAALERSAAGKLFFGNLYDHLVRKLQHPKGHPTIQAVRAAYMLSASENLGIAPSVPMLDVDPAHACFVSRCTPLPFGDTFLTDAVIPPRILTESALDRVSFGEIPYLQDLGESLGYYAALSHTQQAAGTPEFEGTYIGYLSKLDEFLTSLGKEKQLTLVDWQKDLLRQRLAEITDAEHTRKFLTICPPVLVLPSVLMMYGVAVLPFVGLLSLGVTIITTAVSAHAESQRRPVKELLDSSATIAQAGLPKRFAG